MNVLDCLFKRFHQNQSHPKPEERTVPPPTAQNNYVVAILDSCRYDALMAAGLKILSLLGQVECRWSYASWTAPSHYNLLMGLLPRESPKHVYASEYSKRDFLKYNLNTDFVTH